MGVFYIKIKDKGNDISVEIAACDSFCKTNHLIGIPIVESNAKDCNMLEKPPKLITKVADTVAARGVKFCAIEWQPFVISTTPSAIVEIGRGKRLKIGESEVITTKKIAIIVPTYKIFSVDSCTRVDRFAF